LIDIYVLGVHGDSQVVAWSDATISGIPIRKALPLTNLNFDEISDECKDRLRTIFHAKGFTQLGIGSVICSICSSVLSDKRNVRPVSHFQPEWGCCFSLPIVLGRAGVIKKVEVPLNSDEKAALDESIRELKAAIERIKDDR
jgi:L-lactate dehydrogenase